MSDIDILKTTDDGANVGLIQHVKLDAGGGASTEVKITDGTISAGVSEFEGDTSLNVNVKHAENFVVHISLENVVVSTDVMVIDLSDTTNWPHTNTDHIVLTCLAMDFNPNTSFAGDIELGFLTNVDATNGDFHTVHSIHQDRTAAEVHVVYNHNVHGLDMNITNWFGPTQADQVAFQTDVNLLGPDGNVSYPSGNNDLVMRIIRTAGAIDVSATICYTTRAA